MVTTTTTTTVTTSNDSAIQENAALLLLFSMFALIEGTLRMVDQSKPMNDVDYWTDEDGNGDTIVPVGILLMAGVGEVLFGMLGIYVALFSIMFNYNNKYLTFGFLIFQFILGWFVFTCYVIATPILAAMAAEGTDLLSQSEHRSLIILGNMLGSVNFCYALQGGQFIMGLRLLTAQHGNKVTHPTNLLRAWIWSINMVLAAVSTLYVGILLESKSFSSTMWPIGAPPHVVWRPWLSIVTGVIMLIYGLMSFAVIKPHALLQQYMSMMQQSMPMMFVVTTTAMMINFSWTFGIVPGLAPPIPGAAQHLGLVLAMTILPMYHTIKLRESDEGDAVAVDEKESSDTDDDAVPVMEPPKHSLSDVELVA